MFYSDEVLKMLTSLELRWLNKGDALPFPQLVFCENYIESLGSYFAPFIGELLIENKFYDCKNGLILISTNKNLILSEMTTLEIEIPHVLAHEYRHHWQQFNVTEVEESEFQDKSDNSWLNLVDYYLTYKSEMDALMFSQKKEYSEMDELILDVIRGRVKLESLPKVQEFEEPEEPEEVFEVIKDEETDEEEIVADEEEIIEEENFEVIDSLINKYWDEKNIWTLFS